MSFFQQFQVFVVILDETKAANTMEIVNHVKMPLYVMLLLATSLFVSCGERQTADDAERHEPKETAQPQLTAEQIALSKAISYNRYTLEDEYAYEDTVRVFQWDKIKEQLAIIENLQLDSKRFAVLQNYNNINGKAPAVATPVQDDRDRLSDTLGTARDQSIPLYKPGNSDAPLIYGRDGWLVELLSSDTAARVKVAGPSFDGSWEVPKQYVTPLSDSARFDQVVVVDVTNQNIATLERSDEGAWQILSMNPATSGKHDPPYAMETPLGIFVLQEKKPKMLYTEDGSKAIKGYAPHASRFTNGAYVHGVPTEDPEGEIIEHSPTLGTVPRSHMCVRNATSHAKFIYDWAKALHALVIVIE